MDITPMKASTEAPLRMVRDATATSAPPSLSQLFDAVLTARPFLERPASPTPEQERAWREQAGWRAG